MSDNGNVLYVEIQNELGMHARAAASFVKVAERFKSRIDVSKNDLTANGKSIMGIMMLAAPKGSQITITAEGEDSKEALEALKQIIEDKFGENR